MVKFQHNSRGEVIARSSANYRLAVSLFEKVLAARGLLLLPVNRHGEFYALMTLPSATLGVKVL